MTASLFRWACTALLILPAAAQHPAPNPPQFIAPSGGNGQITLDVVVNDKSGTPVDGLNEQDFTILDNKQPQKILSFSESGGRNATEPAEVVIIIDSLNVSFHTVSYEREQVEKFLAQDGGKLAWPVSLAFVSDEGIQLPQNNYQDGKQLITYLNQDKTALRWMNRSQGFYGAADRINLSLRSLGQLAEYEARKPGRKIVIWLSPGWALFESPNIQLTNKQEESIFNTIVAASAELRHAQITLYAVDPLGTADAGRFRTFEYEQYVKGVTQPRKAGFGNLALQVMAVQSGGRVLNGNNDVAGEIAECVRDLNRYYVLTFAEQPADGPNDYHAIDVKIDRPGVKPQTRMGYYAQPGRAAGAP